MTLPLPSKKRIPWLLIALGLMLASAYLTIRWFVAGALPGKWVGLPEYAEASRTLATDSELWGSLAVVLPFLAALLLGFGKVPGAGSGRTGSAVSLTYPAESKAEKWTAPIVRYLKRFIISVLGTLAFVACLLLIGFVCHKLQTHSG